MFHLFIEKNFESKGGRKRKKEGREKKKTEDRRIEHFKFKFLKKIINPNVKPQM